MDREGKMKNKNLIISVSLLLVAMCAIIMAGCNDATAVSNGMANAPSTSTDVSNVPESRATVDPETGVLTVEGLIKNATNGLYENRDPVTVTGKVRSSDRIPDSGLLEGWYLTLENNRGFTVRCRFKIWEPHWDFKTLDNISVGQKITVKGYFWQNPPDDIYVLNCQFID